MFSFRRWFFIQWRLFLEGVALPVILPRISADCDSIITFLFLHVLPRVSNHYIFLTFSRRYSYFFRNENIKIMREDSTSNMCWLRSKIFLFMKINCDIFANFNSNICSLRRYFCIFDLEYLLITTTFLYILPRISANYVRFLHILPRSRSQDFEFT